MTNKINGIDVSEWELKGVLIPITECKYFEGIGDCKESKGLCVANENCYFKQLKCLQEENAELGKIIDCKTGTIQSLAKVRDDLKRENKELKKRQITKDGFICDCEQNAKYRQALEEIKNITEKLITEQPEYHSCYYKDECGDNCTPKKQSKVEYCCYENADKILTIIDEVLNDRD